jgi:hypothetical protein
MADSSSLLEELALRIRGAPGSGQEEGIGGDAGVCGNSSGSDSETTPTRVAEASEDEDEETALLQSYKENSSALWRQHRKTLRLLLEHLDSFGRPPKQKQPSAAGFLCPTGPSAAASAAAAAGSLTGRRLVQAMEEPAREPDAGDTMAC